MKINASLIVLAGLLTAGPLSALESAELFKADFTSIEKVYRQFPGTEGHSRDLKVENGTLMIDKKRDSGADAFLKLTPNYDGTLPDVYSVKVNFTLREQIKGKAHFCCIVGGHKIINRDVMSYRVEEKKTEMEVGKNAGIKENVATELIFVVTQDRLKVFKDGKKINEIPRARYYDGLYFTIFNQRITLAGVEILKGDITSAIDSPNMLKNSSFETTSNAYPDYWGTVHWGISGGRFINDMDTFRKTIVSTRQRLLTGKIPS